mgnify:CR=1 FL=1
MIPYGRQWIDEDDIAAVVAVAGVYLLSSLAGWMQGYLMAGVTQRVVYRLRDEVERKLARLPLTYFRLVETLFGIAVQFGQGFFGREGIPQRFI